MSLKGRTVALTGNPEGTTRAEFRQLVIGLEAAYARALDESVDLLVVGEGAKPDKLELARTLGVEIVDWAEFQRLVERAHDPVAHVDADVPLAVADAMPSLADLGDRVRILDVALPKVPPGPLTPPAAEFVHYTLDAPTLELVRYLAQAAALRQPCLVEGDTATSKTSAIRFLAWLTGHQVVRLNLNGQTDTSELVGRYVPNDQPVRLDVDALLAHLHLLEAESREILLRAKAEQRALTAVEAQQITANERIFVPAWRFQEGLVPQAMRHGWWVILDEVNLAEPQVLERLNSVLEREPSLVLTEGPGTRFGPGGDVPVHPSFRVFATMNPAEYQGRSILSPAWRDRWVATWQADSPGEVEYRQMLERLVFGRQPDVAFRGLPYRGASLDGAPYEALATVRNVAQLLSRLASLHAGLVRMATPGEGSPSLLGASRRERYVFSRRGLLAVLDALLDGALCSPATGLPVRLADAPRLVVTDAIERTYLQRIRGEDDRERVVQVLRSLGLDAQGFSLDLGG